MNDKVLIVARSGRQLAEAARHAGYSPYVVDLFGDVDTQAVSAGNFIARSVSPLRFDSNETCVLVRDIQEADGPMPLVWGSGFEEQPSLLAALAQVSPTAGCPVATLFAVNEPSNYASLAMDCGFKVPQRADGLQPAKGEWLVKRRGSCGGLGVRFSGQARIHGQRDYFQRRVRGQLLSATFLSRGGRTADLLGVCEMFNLQPRAATPFRFSAAVATPQQLRFLTPRLLHIVSYLTQAFGLNGLCGIDFVVDEKDDLVLLELNARPPATFDLLVDPGLAFAAHLKPSTPTYVATSGIEEVRAMAVYYLDDPIVVPKTLDWPGWIADRPQPGARLVRDAPLCSVRSAANNSARARELLGERFALLDRLIAGWSRGID